MTLTNLKAALLAVATSFVLTAATALALASNAAAPAAPFILA
jgi:hypothetical protein